jgi:2-hydroxycyclohexanecarboxyl-CoA dehydrogenase
LGARLSGKIAAITGGAGGIGAATGGIFAAQGARVALVDHNGEAIERAVDEIKRVNSGADVFGVVADLGIEAESDRAVAQIVAECDGLDILVNNVGIRRYEALADAPWHTWDDIFRINLLSYVSMSRAALVHLRRSGCGSIVNVSSTYAVYGRKGMGAYDATKAGVLALTRTLAHEEAEHNVRVNAVCPGYTKTPFHVRRLGNTAVDNLVPPCALKRWAAPTELAYPILWLASDEASYVTGTTLMVDGGLPA